MENFVIEGGVPLEGTVSISGAKNAALPIMTAALLGDGVSVFHNVPDLHDIATLGALLSHLGCGVQRDGPEHRVTIEVGDHIGTEAPYDHVKRMRASVLVLGPLLARFRKARVSLPGGCAIGARPVDLHLKGMEKLGARIDVTGGYIEAKADRGLSGAEIRFDFPTVGGTENLMMAAVLARGRTLLVGAAREPEIEELATVLNKMGANISGAGTDVVSIEGVDGLRPVEHAIMPDRIEAGTYMVAGAITGGDVLVRGVRVDHMGAVIDKLIEVGIDVQVREEGVHVRSNGARRCVDIRTAPYPGFPTDMQAQTMALLCLCSGRSVVEERVFENRFMHVGELQRMGARIAVRGSLATVTGVDRLSGAKVMATDLRASASLVLAGLAARGVTEVLRIYHIDRGYEDIVQKLSGVGARIRRVPGTS
jgi:UDP-N-acetylglucosamine 1-carboxyvinyltransferase